MSEDIRPALPQPHDELVAVAHLHSEASDAPAGHCASLPRSQPPDRTAAATELAASAPASMGKQTLWCDRPCP